ncbi:hypothetical protein NLG97_g5467 [Lecanicillium saksenae]|uniref:Uncharacterized protein n=1 Tax=Lecanicillium saksenae TaxID=468837 RepID=A0ACC1QUT1_9HYPO|nr:hypothetical protein NLG97_g5467 [Lecanicillium saksenae]
MKQPHVRPTALFLLAAFVLSKGAHSEPRLALIESEYQNIGDDYPALQQWLDEAVQLSVAPKACPALCSEAATVSGAQNGFLFSDEDQLKSCNESMIIGFNVRSNDDEKIEMGIRACTADYSATASGSFTIPESNTAALCPTPNYIIGNASVRYSFATDETSDQSVDSNDSVFIIEQVGRHLATKAPSCNDSTIAFGYYKTAVLGVFGGTEVHQHGITQEILNNIPDAMVNAHQSLIVQLCEPGKRGADYTVGVAISSAQNLKFVKDAVKTWADGECFAAKSEEQKMMTVTLRVPPDSPSMLKTSNSTTLNSTSALGLLTRSPRFLARGECKTTKVNAGDGCWAVAQRCGISQDKLEEYNPRDHFCNTLVKDETVCCSAGTLPEKIPNGNNDGTCVTKSVNGGDTCSTMAQKCGLDLTDFEKINDRTCDSPLAVGQYVCCTYGKMPDLRPKQNGDGSCASYPVAHNDGCSMIAVARQLTVDDLEEFNKDTWGWQGCEKLPYGINICVSKGSPPMPNPVENAECGPTVPGTQPPPPGTSLADLNQCPLKVCCNIWGHCGFSDDFCTVSKSSTGAPGTAAPNVNGCISNCGRDIVGSPSAPEKPLRIGYFEAWNHNRNCLTMDVSDINTNDYTHIHFAFATVTEDFRLDISQVQEQFEGFKKLTGVKRIISLGGWDFSALPGTFHVLRDAVKAENRPQFVKNLVSFVQDHGLDGIDIDWEYPGAPDIPDIPSDDPHNGLNYLLVLNSVKSYLGGSKSVSFAAPASYWYLKAFPVALMSKRLDYIVFMTYDLHGQWDYGNKWTSSGCPTGNCLRSHVNMTETNDALAMITKAGVPANKIALGIASYGRSFKMATKGCWAPMCLFTGTNRISNAAEGRCTKTAGYISNAEISEIIQYGQVNKHWEAVGSHFLVYNDTEWVAYMDDDDKKRRGDYFSQFNFGGTSEWAIDLRQFTDGSGMDQQPDESFIEIRCTARFTDFDALELEKDTIPPICLELYLIDVALQAMEDALNKYKKLVDGGYDDKFNYYSDYIKRLVPMQIDEFMASGKADDYFTCQGTMYGYCCNDCQWGGCLTNCRKAQDCKSGMYTEKVKCPDTLKYREDGVLPEHYKLMSADYHLDDAEGFWKEIGQEYSIDESWVKFDDRFVWTGASCQFAGKDSADCAKKSDFYFHHYPMVKDDMKVPNPKDMIGKSYDKALELLQYFKIARSAIRYDTLPSEDLLDAVSVPAFTYQTAVEKMDDIVQEVKTIKKKELKEFILDFITGVIMIVPGIGEVLGPELAATRTFLRLLGDAGDAGMAIFGIVEDPKSGLMGIFDAFATSGLSRGGISKASDKRRGMRDEEIETLGPTMKKSLNRIEEIRGAGVCAI